MADKVIYTLQQCFCFFIILFHLEDLFFKIKFYKSKIINRTKQDNNNHFSNEKYKCKQKNSIKVKKYI